MDIITKIEMQLMDDLYSSQSGTISKPYSMYYESLQAKQSKIMVSSAIERILTNDKNTSCEYGEDDFTLKIQ